MKYGKRYDFVVVIMSIFNYLATPPNSNKNSDFFICFVKLVEMLLTTNLNNAILQN